MPSTSANTRPATWPLSYRFNLRTLPMQLLVAAVTCAPRRERVIQMAEYY
jgi:hypothetical protein